MATRTDSAARLIKGEKLCTLLVILQYFVSRLVCHSYIFRRISFLRLSRRGFSFLGFRFGQLTASCRHERGKVLVVVDLGDVEIIFRPVVRRS